MIKNALFAYPDSVEVSESNRSYFDNQSINELPVFDFRAVSLCRSSSEQLARIYESVRGGVGKAALDRSGLWNLLLGNCFDPIRGIYIPTSPDVYLKGKLPTLSEQLSTNVHTTLRLQPFGAEYFTNALVIPENYGTAQFNPNDAPAPKLRLTNIGFLIVTLEYDCQTQAEFEEILAWTRGCSGDGDIKTSPFAVVDRELCRLQDYRGYCIVLSGSRSIHFHCLFSTTHLKNARYDSCAELRYQTLQQNSALLENAHRIYWNHINTVFKSVLNPSLAPDSVLKQATQWRRTPWGIRTLEKDSNILGLTKGTQIPQLVIREKIRTRASRGSHDYLVPSRFSTVDPIPFSADTSRQDNILVVTDASRLVSLLQDDCRSEWGREYPKPVEVDRQNGNWIIKFRNHATDKKPSTIVIGQHRRLIINGRHDFGDRQFYLSDHTTANETIEYLQRRTGQAPTTLPAQESSLCISERMADWCHVPILDEYRDTIKRHFAEPLSDKPLQEIQKAYREKLWHEFIQSRDWSDKIVVISGEGIGKTRTLLPLLSHEAQDDNCSKADDDIERFAGFAFRSHEQAERKAAEFRNVGYPIVVWRSFWDHYKEACAAQQQKEISRDEFGDASPNAIFQRISEEQPAIFERLEQVRKNLWASCKFSAYSTILAVPHRTVHTWDTGILTRAWHHPDFDPSASLDEHKNLRDKIKLARVVLDDPEADDFLHVLRESTFEFLHRTLERHPDWRNRRRDDRLSIYRRLKTNKELPGNLFAEFENFDELMRLDLATLDMVPVDCHKIPFGYDHTNSGIYRERHGDKYYIGPKRWLFACDRHVTVLTTETLVMDAVVGVANRYRHRGGESKLPSRLTLDHAPGIYPLKIPAFIDKRARKGGVTALAQEITKSNANAIVISDMVRDVRTVMTFQGMKGVNGLEANDIYIVVTCVSPAKYAELNVIGRWLGIPNIIQIYYQDQINQAVGRNRGFRQSLDRETKTVLVTSRRLWENVLSRLLSSAPRAQLYKITGRPW